MSLMEMARERGRTAGGEFPWSGAAGRRFIIAIVLGIGLVLFHPYWVHPSRYGQLRCVVNRHTGFAHMTRGMNTNTIDALRRVVRDRDIPVLIAMLDDRDHVTQMTAAQVLARMGDPGLRALEFELSRMRRQTGANYNRFDAVREAIMDVTGREPATPRFDNGAPQER